MMSDVMTQNKRRALVETVRRKIHWLVANPRAENNRRQNTQTLLDHSIEQGRLRHTFRATVRAPRAGQFFPQLRGYHGMLIQQKKRPTESVGDGIVARPEEQR